MTQKKITFYTIAGCSRTDGEVEPVTYEETYRSVRSAAKAVADEINEVIDLNNETVEDDSKKLPHVTADDCMDGYRLSVFNDADDILDISIVKHSIAVAKD